MLFVWTRSFRDLLHEHMAIWSLGFGVLLLEVCAPKLTFEILRLRDFVAELSHGTIRLEIWCNHVAFRSPSRGLVRFSRADLRLGVSD